MKKVMVFGTFDILHPGHISFLRQARKLGDYLIVVVARNQHVRAAKGKLPGNLEKLRIKNVRKTKIPDKVLLGSRTHNFYRTIRTYRPDIIALGYDQKPSLLELRRDLRRHRLRHVTLIRLRSYKPEIYKSSKMHEKDL